MKITLKFREKRKSLENLAKMGILYCEKHDIKITPGRMYRSHCYVGRRKKGICSYLNLVSYNLDEGCKR